MSVCDGKPCYRRDRLHTHGENTAVVVREPLNVEIEIDLGGGYVTQSALDDITTKADEEYDFDADLVGDALVRNVRLSVLPRLFNGHALTDTDTRRALNGPRQSLDRPPREVLKA